tara:strand:- start:267 stop:617 length:351 start_codon:yes stop_codon:yes gene_type:complete
MKNLTRDEWIDKNWEKWAIKEELRAKYAEMSLEQAEKIWTKQSGEWNDIQEKQRKINFKKTGIKETNLERKKREEYEKIEKIKKRDNKTADFIKKQPGSACFVCKTKVDEEGLCFC